jgi:MOSC domain-containing protein YiiM
MKKLIAEVVSVHTGDNDDMRKETRGTVVAELDGFVGDGHRSYTRSCWSGGDKQAEGTVRRNERQWSAVSVEELGQISRDMDLTEALSAETLGANLCFEGIDDMSKLPKGTLLKFPSGAELVVVEFNPPCHYMGEKIAAQHQTRSGDVIPSTAFSKAAKLSRGLVGVIDAVGEISAGDECEVLVYEHPSWLR